MTIRGWIAAAALATIVVPAAAQTSSTAVRVDPGTAVDLPSVDVSGQRSRARSDQQGPTRGLDGSQVISNTNTIPVPVFELPRTVDVVTPERLEQIQVDRPSQYFRDIPGVTFGGTEGSFGTNQTYIRGLRVLRSLVDGMPFENSPYGTVGLIGVERVEVFEGPSAALQGGGDLGGTINYVTKQPLDTPQYRVDLGTGFEKRLNRPLGTASFDATSPINDQLSYRTIIGTEYRERFYEPALKDDFRGYINTGLRWRPDSQTTVVLQANYFHGDIGAGIDAVPALGTVLANPKGYTIPFGRTYTDPNTSTEPVTYTQLRLQADRKLSEIWTLNGGAHFNRDSFYYKDVLIPGSLGADGRTLSRSGIGVDIEDFEVGGRVNLIGDFRVAGLPNMLVVGADTSYIKYTNSKYRFDTVRPIDILNPDYSNPILSQIAAPTQVQATLRDGFFANDRLTVLPGVDIFGGLRGDYVQQANTTKNGGTIARLNDSAVSGNAGISWAIRPDTRVYFSWNEAFQPQTPGSMSASNQPFAPLTGYQYEVGIKHIVNDRLSLTGSLFRIYEDNVLTPNPTNPLFSVATGQARSQGAELSANGTILPGWQASAAYAYLDTTITKDNAGNLGHRLATVPRHGVRLFSIYEFQDGTFQGVGLGGGMRYASMRFAENANKVPLPDYAVFDAVAYYKFGQYKLQLNIENLADRKYFSGGTSINSVYYGQPLTAYMRLSRNF